MGGVVGNNGPIKDFSYSLLTSAQLPSGTQIIVFFPICGIGRAHTLSCPDLTPLQGAEVSSLIFMPLESCILHHSHERRLQVLLRKEKKKERCWVNINVASGSSSIGPGLHCIWDCTKLIKRKTVSQRQRLGDERRIMCNFRVVQCHLLLIMRGSIEESTKKLKVGLPGVNISL